MNSPRNHPYLDQPNRAFWSRAVTRNWDPATLYSGIRPIFAADSKIMSAGSCFAANIVPYLEAEGYEYTRTEHAEPGDQFGYGLYSAAYGNIYTPRQLRQLLDRALGRFTPAEDRWHIGETVVDPFRPGLPYAAESDEEFDLVTSSHLERVLEAVRVSNVFVFTLGLTEAWVSAEDGAVFPACPGTIAGTFDPERHHFKNFRVAELVGDIEGCVARLREISPGIKIVLTVSPVPLVATATDRHVFTATVASKSALRAACDEVVSSDPGVVYFPAYEIVTDPAAVGYFEPDRRNVSQDGIKAVMAALLANSEPVGERTGDPGMARSRRDAAESLSKLLAKRECEEVFAEKR